MNSLLNQSGNGLNNIIEQVQLYQALLDLGKSCLPHKIAQHLIGVSFEKNTLICQLDDNLWTTPLRFHSSDLLSAYQTHFPHLKLNSFKVQIIPLAERKVLKAVTMEKISLTTAKEMQDLSKKVTSKGLKQALKKLSKHTEDS